MTRSETSTTTKKPDFIGKLLKTLNAHHSEVSCLAVLPDGTLASGSTDKYIHIWVTVNVNRVKTLNSISNTIVSLAALPDGTLASGSTEWIIQIWDTITGSEIKRFTGFTDQVYS